MIKELSATRTIEAPEAPTVIPNVWELPDTSSGICECGNNCTVNRAFLVEIASHLGLQPDKEWLTHDEVIDLAMEVWEYDGVCEFFLMVINDSAKAVFGEVAERYPFEKGIEIVGYFSKTWQGCPDEECRVVREFGDS